MFDLDTAIRKIPDFPKKGILFYDITSVLTNPQAFAFCIQRMKELFSVSEFDAVAGIESRGFLFAAPFAKDCGLPLILIRKKGKLPGKTYQEDVTLEYGTDVIEVHQEDVKEGMRILLVDDLIATGGTLASACKLLKRGAAEVRSIFGVIGLPFLNYEEKLKGIPVKTLINYDNE